MRRIPLRARDGSIRALALVDDAAYELLVKWRWHLTPDGYAARKAYLGAGRERTVQMHRQILDAQTGIQVDHINRNRLYNRRCNLRPATAAENRQNLDSTGRRGVVWVPDRRRWRAQVRLNRKLHFLGYFTDPDAATEAAHRFRQEHMPFSAEDQQTAGGIATRR